MPARYYKTGDGLRAGAQGQGRDGWVAAVVQQGNGDLIETLVQPSLCSRTKRWTRKRIILNDRSLVLASWWLVPICSSQLPPSHPTLDISYHKCAHASSSIGRFAPFGFLNRPFDRETLIGSSPRPFLEDIQAVSYL